MGKHQISIERKRDKERGTLGREICELMVMIAKLTEWKFGNITNGQCVTKIWERYIAH